MKLVRLELALTATTSRIGDLYRTGIHLIGNACAKYPRVVDESVKRPWIHVLCQLIWIERGVASSNTQALDLVAAWKFFGAFFGAVGEWPYFEGTLEAEASDAMHGCSWYKCPLWSARDAAAGCEFLVCADCHRVCRHYMSVRRALIE